MTTSDRKASIRRFYEEALNRGQLDLIDEFAAPGFVAHDTPAALAGLVGPAALRAIAQQVRSGYSDLDFQIEDMLAEDDRVAVRWSMRGTHTGELFGMPPTGRSVQVRAIVIWRFEGDRVAELWPMVDRLGVLQQLQVSTAA